MKSFLILSDIHASTIDPSSSKAPSYVSSFSASAAGKTDPIEELGALCERERLSPDYLLCAGDITDRSEPTAFNYAWTRLSGLAQKLECQLVATVGNHDLDSRYQSNKFDPRGYAMSLLPSIPLGDRARFLEYWAENFTLFSDGSCNILILNTAAYHGGGGDAASAEMEHGRVSPITIERVRQRLSDAPAVPINLVLCHHHPIGQEPSDSELLGLTRGGEQLLQVLEESDAAWVIVHGHKHRPELLYGLGSGNSPVVLSSASFSAQVNADAQNKNPNQVHLLVCEPDAAAEQDLNVAGHVRSWTWQPGRGWRRAHGQQGLPHLAGYGYRGFNSDRVALALEQAIKASGDGYLNWDAALNALPKVRFMNPADFDRFQRSLDVRGIEVLRDRDGLIAQVGQRR